MILLPSSRVEIMGELKAHCKRLVKVFSHSTGRDEYAKGVANHLGLALTYLYMAYRICKMYNIGPSEPFGPASSHLVGATIAPARGQVF